MIRISQYPAGSDESPLVYDADATEALAQLLFAGLGIGASIAELAPPNRISLGIPKTSATATTIEGSREEMAILFTALDRFHGFLQVELDALRDRFEMIPDHYDQLPTINETAGSRENYRRFAKLAYLEAAGVTETKDLNAGIVLSPDQLKVAVKLYHEGGLPIRDFGNPHEHP